MNIKINQSVLQPFLMLSLVLLLTGCINSTKKATNKKVETATYPSDVIPFMDEWTVLCGDGTRLKE